jgi:hypothetical protein
MDKLTLKYVWEQERIPVVLRRTGKGRRLRVRVTGQGFASAVSRCRVGRAIKIVPPGNWPSIKMVTSTASAAPRRSSKSSAGARISGARVMSSGWTSLHVTRRWATIDAGILAGGCHGQPAEVMRPTLVVAGTLRGVRKTAMGHAQ